MGDNNSIETFHNACFKISYQKYYYIIFYFISVPLDVPRLVSNLYSTPSSLKQFISLAIKYEYCRYYTILPAKTEIPILFRCSFGIPMHPSFMLNLSIKSNFHCEQKHFSRPLVSTTFL